MLPTSGLLCVGWKHIDEKVIDVENNKLFNQVVPAEMPMFFLHSVIQQYILACTHF